MRLWRRNHRNKIDIYSVKDGSHLIFTDEELLQQEYQKEATPDRMNSLEMKIEESLFCISWKNIHNTGKSKWARGDSNSGPPPCEGDVITN